MDNFVYVVIRKVYFDHPNILADCIFTTDYSDVKTFYDEEKADDFVRREFLEEIDFSSPFVLKQPDEVISDSVVSCKEYVQETFNDHGIKYGVMIIKQKVE